MQRLTEASTDFDLTKTAHSGDDKDQTDVCVASSVGVQLPTAVITVKGMLVIRGVEQGIPLTDCPPPSHHHQECTTVIPILLVLSM